MVDTADKGHDERQRQHRAERDSERPAADGPAQIAPEVPLYPVDLLRDARLNGRGNEPVRSAVLQRMQQTYGNRAARRFLQAQRANRAGPSPTADQVGKASLSPVSIQLQPAEEQQEEERRQEVASEAPTQAGGSRAISPENLKEDDLAVQTTRASLTPTSIQRDDGAPGQAPSSQAPSQTDTQSTQLIVDDKEQNPQPGQMKKTEFLAKLRTEVTKTADEALAGTIWSSRSCPLIPYWFDHYANQPAQDIERRIRKYAPEAQGAKTANDYIPIVCERVGKAVRHWVATGEVTGVPEGVPLNVPGADTLIGGALNLLGGALFGGGKTGTGASGAPVQRTPAPGVGGPVLFKGTDGSTPAQPDDPQALQGQLGPGRPIEGEVQSRMGSAFGHDFSGVRVHTDSTGAELSSGLRARAFTVGEHVAFGSGEYQPGTPVGDALIAHEFAHVVQQAGSSSNQGALQKGEGSGQGPLEEDADTAAVGAVVSLWGKAKGFVANVAQNAMPALRSGLRLQRCRSDVEALTPADRSKVDEDFKKQNTDVKTELLNIETVSMQTRRKAVEEKLIPEDVFNAWDGARTALLAMQPQLMQTGEVDETLKARASKHMEEFYKLFRELTKPYDWKEKKTHPRGWHWETRNPYLEPNALEGVPYNYFSEGALARLKGAKTTEQWKEVVKDFNDLATGFDRYIGDKLREKGKVEQGKELDKKAGEAGTAIGNLETALKGGNDDPAARGAARKTMDAYARAFREQVAPLDYQRKRTGPRATGMETWNDFFTVGAYQGFKWKLDRAESADDWKAVFEKFDEIKKAKDKYMADPKAKGRSEEADTLEFAGGLSKKLDQLREDHPKAKRVQAVFYPKERGTTATGGPAPEQGIPLYFYLYRDEKGDEGDKEWHLVDLTTPLQPKENTEEGGTEDNPPTDALFRKLDSKLHFPEGYVYWQIPDGKSGKVETKASMTLSEWLTYIGVGLALTALAVATAGASTTVTVPLLVLSGIVGAGAVAAGMKEKSEQGMLTTMDKVMGAAQIVAELAGAAAAGFGKIAITGVGATGKWARLAVLADRLYVPAVKIKVASEGVNLLLVTADTMAKYEEIDKLKGSEDEKNLAKERMVSGLVTTGLLSMMSISGDLPQLGRGRRLTLHFPKEGSPPVATLTGTELPSNLKFSQKDVDWLTSDKTLTIDQLAESMKTQGWKGDPLHIIEMPDGSMVSLDNRRLLAARKAGLKDVPVLYHAPNEPMPPQWAADGFKLKKKIYQLPDGSLVVGGGKGTLKYREGDIPKTYGEAALFRTANQGNIPEGGKFPLYGRYDDPKIRNKPTEPGEPDGPPGGDNGPGPGPGPGGGSPGGATGGTLDVPKLKGVDIKSLYDEAIIQVKATPAGQRPAMWEQLAAQIEQSAPGKAISWKGSQKMSLSDGGVVYFGDKGPALVFDPKGNMYRATTTNPEQLKIGADGKFVPNYDKMTKL